MYAWLGKVGVGMDAVKFFKETGRMCAICKTCKYCPLGNYYACKLIAYIENEDEDIEEIVKIVEQWAKEHPQKTYKDDILEKFPNVQMFKGYPDIH